MTTADSSPTAPQTLPSPPPSPPPTTLSPPVFDLCGPLPQGTTILEASAGTGKTHTIAGLAVRYVAEGIVRVEELMLVTFGRQATAELRERVRSRLRDVTEALSEPASARAADDELVRHLADVRDDEVHARYVRLSVAVADFDAATITTTHGFCRQMLAGLGIAADLDADVTFTEATKDLVAQTATDLYLGDYGSPHVPAPPEAFGFPCALSVARNAVADPFARLEPQAAAPDAGPGAGPGAERDAGRDAEPDAGRDAEPHPDPVTEPGCQPEPTSEAGSEASVRLRFAERARDELARRKRAARVLDYDDLLGFLRDALASAETGMHACDRIRNRYQVVLVDEFQDTDPVQWEILERAFHGHRTLVLIGDPKQAIYAFRGADVVTYLVAKGSADAEATLGRNWRSDRPLVDGLRHLLGGAALGDPRIVVHTVDAVHQEPSLEDAPSSAPVRVRRVPRSQFDKATKAKVTVGEARPFVACDVAADIVSLLSSGAHLVGTGGHRRPLAPADIAVLVHRNADGTMVHEALTAVGVPAVLTATTSVFASPAAAQWRVLLAALEQPQRTGLVRNAALSDFLGWTAAELANADDAALDELAGRLRRWSDLLTRRGVAALLEAATTTGLPARVLARKGGERDLTDLRHIGQALHAAASEGNAGVSSLVQWLRRRMAEAVGDPDEERGRRLDSDAEAVQVMTVWRAKGLEFPVVYAPYLWDRYVPGTPDPLRMHDEAHQRVLDVGGHHGSGYGERLVVHREEESGESLRLAYVALTRARCQVVVHWVPGSSTRTAPLHRLVFGTRRDGVVPEMIDVPDERRARERFAELADLSGGLIAVEVADSGPGGSLVAAPASAGELVVREFDRSMDRIWARTSYSGITAGLHEASGALSELSEPEGPGTTDEPPGSESPESRPLVERPARQTITEPPEPAPPEPAPPEPAPPEPAPPEPPEPASSEPLVSPMSALPAGAAFGTLVHAVLERSDFAAADLRAELTAAAEAEGAQRFGGVAPDVLAEGLLPSLNTPLGPLAGGLRLADLARADRLDEMDFELPLAGGDVPTGEVHVAEIADLLARHLSVDDPLSGYAADLGVPLLEARRLRGFLAGSVDAVLRVRRQDGSPRYLVVDYKTNRLGGGQVLTAQDYHPGAMVTAMRRAHYPLQALLYSVALHRYLRWRQPGYDPTVHLGGVLYLFLRGMCGPDTPSVDGTPHGVFAWSPPPSLVTELSDLLHGGAG